jgi:plastocyanin
MSSRIALLTLLAALLLPSALAQAQGNPRLVASVGANDAEVITLRDANGNAVTNLNPGTYDIAVSDLSAEHNFHLSGPNVNQTTSIAAREEVTWTVTFTDGRYTFVCDAHPTTMRGGFTVGTVAPPPPPPARLTASVGPGKRISLRPKTVTAGSVTVTVTDRSRVDNFHLTGPGVNRKTGVAFRGRVTWRLTLRSGRYTYRSDKTKRLRGTFTVTPSA